MGNKHSLADPHHSHPYPHHNHHHHHPYPHSNNGPIPSTNGYGTMGHTRNGGGVGQPKWRGDEWRTATIEKGKMADEALENQRNSARLSSPPLGPTSSAASSSSTALPNATNSTGAASKTSSKPCTPRADDGGGRKAGGGGFLAQLFHGGTLGRKTAAEKKAAAAAAAASATTIMANHPNSAPQSPMPQNNNSDHNRLPEHFDLLPDRPAIRLDSRLVCKYEVLSVVGKGSFSQVLRVRDRITKHYYAVKLVSMEQDFGAVNNELAILGRVKHPFVIRLEEVFRSATKLFIVMEMASGGEMYDRVVAKGRYTESEARLAIKMLLTGLDYLHRSMITHRDLKPENLLYSDSRPDARLLITDFGLAHQARLPDEKMSETCGTPEYIAPEILLRLPYTNKVDCWAVGVIAYILMSGIMPFDDDCRSRLYTHIITANYVYYPQFWSGSDQGKHFVDSLLETSPEHRPSATDALRHHWMTGERATKGLTSQKEKMQPIRRDWTEEAKLQQKKKKQEEETEKEEQLEENDDDNESNVNGTTVQRTKSSRSIRSVTRSDHGHRVDPREVDQLAEDLQRLAKQRHHHRYTSSQQQQHNGGGTQQQRQHQNGHNHSKGGPTTGGGGGPRQNTPYTTNGQVTKNYGVF